MHLTEAQINDVVDDALPDAEAASLRAHLVGCAECQSEVDLLRVTLQRMSRLPRSIQPERDLRGGIWAQADSKTLWSFRYPLAAAAVLLIAISSAVTVLLTRDSNEPVVRVTENAPTPVDLVRLEDQYSSELESLQHTLRDQRADLSPETVRILEENLEIIDKAIAEARAALVNDPQSDMLGELLRSAYQRKLDLLKQAARSSSQT